MSTKYAVTTIVDGNQVDVICADADEFIDVCEGWVPTSCESFPGRQRTRVAARSPSTGSRRVPS